MSMCDWSDMLRFTMWLDKSRGKQPVDWGRSFQSIFWTPRARHFVFVNWCKLSLPNAYHSREMWFHVMALMLWCMPSNKSGLHLSKISQYAGAAGWKVQIPIPSWSSITWWRRHCAQVTKRRYNYRTGCPFNFIWYGWGTLLHRYWNAGTHEPLFFIIDVALKNDATSRAVSSLIGNN